MQYILTHPHDFWQACLQHLYLVAIPIGFVIVIAIPFTILATRVPKLYPFVLGFSNAMQTVPSLALLAVMIAIGLGIGTLPAVVALFIYALMPVVRNTYVGIVSVAPEIKDAAVGMGVTKWQLLWYVELPLALKVMIAGIRSAIVSTIGFATLAALIGAGGLGALILQGLGLADNAMVLAGTIPAVVLAFAAEWLMSWLERALTPRGLRV
ncbi:MAG: ABC transporter permease [Alicyclobacillus sp.]|nr:ABC transporter permease [Alicyclobacillus sp.]